MLLEFYREGPLSPAAYDRFMHLDGSMSYNDKPRTKKDRMCIVVETRYGKTSIYQGFAIFGMIFNERMATVVFYDFA